MGGLLSYLYFDPTENILDPQTGFSRKQKKLMKHTWDKFIRPNLIDVGVDAMLKLLAAHQDIKNVFPDFKSIPDSELETNRKFHVHCQMIMTTVNNAVDAFFSDDLDLFAAILTMSGERHGKRRITPQQFEPMKKTLLDSLRQQMKSHWTDELSELWTRAVVKMIDGIISGINDHNKTIN